MSHDEDDALTRREALVGGLAGAATLAAGAAPVEAAEGAERRAEPGRPRLPVVYLPHGGGPWPFVDLGFPKAELDALAGYLRGLARVPPRPPRAVLVISAHWEAPVPTVMTGARPPMLYDYDGFPPEAYALTWPAPGHPALAARVGRLLAEAGIPSAEDPGRGFDHGTFVPMKLGYPAAEVPTVQLSLKAGLDPAEHLRIGRALAPLRDDGVFIVGSGSSFHNLRSFFGGRGRPAAEAFDGWLRDTAACPAEARDRRLAEWWRAPGAREAHPREEHLLPLMVVAGAAGADRGRLAYAGTMFGLAISAFHFG